MQPLTHLLLVCVCAASRGAGEPLGEALLRRSSGYGSYARDYARDYEPYMFAAIPLHSPMPVLRVLSSVPLTSRDKYHASSAPRPVYSRPTKTYDEYDAVALDDYDSSESQYYSASGTYAAHSKPYASSLSASASSAPEEPPTILYARPSPHGGYTYRRHPLAKPPPKRAPVVADEPFILRVHKYKIVKDP